MKQYIMKVGDLLENKAIITDKTGKQRTIKLPEFGQVTIQMQNGKIIYIDKLDKEKFWSKNEGMLA